MTRKIFGTLEVPEKATHVMIHGTTETGAVGPKLTLEHEPGKWADLFPIGEVSADWLMSWCNPGPYRVAFWFVDAQGKKLRLGPTTGAVNVQPTAARKLKKRDGAPDEDVAAQAEAGGLSGIGLFRLLREMQREARADADRTAAVQLERDRAFYTTLGEQQRAFMLEMKKTREEEEETEEESEEGSEDKVANAVVKILKEMGTQAEPFLKSVGKKIAEKASE